VAAALKRVIPLVIVAATLTCGRQQKIIVGSKNFTESDLLAEIVAQQIERRTGLPVERRLHLGGTFVCHQAITQGGRQSRHRIWLLARRTEHVVIVPRHAELGLGCVIPLCEIRISQRPIDADTVTASQRQVGRQET